MDELFSLVEPFLSEDQVAKIDKLAAIWLDTYGVQISRDDVLTSLFVGPKFDQLLDDKLSSYLTMCEVYKKYMHKDNK